MTGRKTKPKENSRLQVCGNSKDGNTKGKRKKVVVHICYGGYFTMNTMDGPLYHEGKVVSESVFVDDVSIDWVMPRIKDLGFENVIKLHYRKGYSVNRFNGIVLLGDDIAEMRVRILLAKYGAVTIYVEHEQSQDVVEDGLVDKENDLGLTKDKEVDEKVGGHLEGPIIDGVGDCSYQDVGGQCSNFRGPVVDIGQDQEQVQEREEQETAADGVQETDPAHISIPDAATDQFVEVPITEEVTGVVEPDGEADDEEEFHVGEGATLLVEEVHFVESDSHDKEVELAREKVREYRRGARVYEVSEEEEEGYDDEVVREEAEVEAGGNDGDSIYHSSDSQWSVRTGESESDSDNDSAQRVPLHWPQYDPSQPFLDFSLRLGFTGPKEFKEALIRYALSKQVDYKITRNTKTKVSAECKCTNGDDGPRCRWRVYASWQTTNGVFRVKNYNNHHQCIPAFKNRWVTVGVIAKHFKDRLEENTELKSWQLKKLVKEKMKCEVSLSKYIKAKMMHYEEQMTKEKEEFGKLWSYVAELRQSNSGNSVFVRTHRDEATGGLQFKRMYVCLSACKEGFLSGCRKFIGVDGCFLKGLLKGELLAAIGMDANNQMYPIAWAVVEVENTDSWKWFLKLLSEDLRIDDGRGWAIISDQQKGLMNAIQSIIPTVGQRMCCRHIYANWRKKHRGKDLKKRF